MQWAAEAESGAIDQFEVGSMPETSSAGVALVRTAALFTPGTLINHTELLAHRLAQPTLSVNKNDAAALQLTNDDTVFVDLNGRQMTVKLNISKHTPEGVALLRGVPYQPGTAELKLSKSKIEN
jgi:hypothetical protein